MATKQRLEEGSTLSKGPNGAGIRRMRHFHQRLAIADPVLDSNAPEISSDVLMMLAGKRTKLQGE